MSSETPETPRDIELRRMLVATSSAAPARPRRRWSVGAPIVAFALAGALTGTVSAAALTAQQERPSATLDDPVSYANMTSFIQDDTTLFGGPRVVDGVGEEIVSLGAKPAGASELAFSLRCVDVGTFTLTLDGEAAGRITCDEQSSTTAGGSAYLAVGDASTHTLTVSTGEESRYLLWASWATRATPPEPSSEQAAALADGEVTEAEYHAQFDRYAECMNDAGYPLGSIDKTGTVITAVRSEAAVTSGSDSRCYALEFEQVDTAWQSSHAPQP